MVTRRWSNAHVTKTTSHLWVCNSVNARKRIEPVQMGIQSSLQCEWAFNNGITSSWFTTVTVKACPNNRSVKRESALGKLQLQAYNILSLSFLNNPTLTSSLSALTFIPPVTRAMVSLWIKNNSSHRNWSDTSEQGHTHTIHSTEHTHTTAGTLWLFFVSRTRSTRKLKPTVYSDRRTVYSLRSVIQLNNRL